MDNVKIADFDFNLFLERVENILKQYEDESTRLFYLRGLRFPVMNSKVKELASQTNKVSDKPFYPIHSAKLIRILFLYHASRYNEYNELLFYNPNRKDSKAIYPLVLKDKTSISDVIYEFYPMLSISEMSIIISDVTSVLEVLTKVLELDPIAVYDLNIESANFIIYKYPDVRAIRFSELLGENIYGPYTAS